jgi:hypothetical protein
MKAHNGFNAYKPKVDEFKIAGKRNTIPHKEYVPEVHPQNARLVQARELQSLWTPSESTGGKP